jgi:hypothetical protein
MEWMEWMGHGHEMVGGMTISELRCLSSWLETNDGSVREGSELVEFPK